MDFSGKVIAWYEVNHRDMPWRHTKDPYKIWLSEIILQQTRVAQGLPYFLRFVSRFPTLKSLAKATERDVLLLWQGLGYYRRARNMYACAQLVATNYKGKFPTSYEGLLALPGIGSYTASAIASLAFDKPHAVVDGNVYRVLARFFGLNTDITTCRGRHLFAEKANSLLDRQRPAIYNQAIMEFGALQCVPQTPKCDMCLLSLTCFANRHGQQQQLPCKAVKKKIKKRYFTYFVIQQGDKLAFQKRVAKDIWEGLYDFFMIESSRIRNPVKLMEEQEELSRYKKYVVPKKTNPIIEHVLSHQRIMARFVRLSIPPSKTLSMFSMLRFYSFDEVCLLPKSVLIERYLAHEDLISRKN